MSSLRICKLGDLIEFQRGYDLPKSEFKDGPYPVQSSNGILGFHNEYKVEAPGITIGRSGTVGLPHLLNTNFFPHNTALFVKDFKGNNVQYIYYLLKQLKLGDKGSGSGVPTMNRNHLHPLKIKAYRDAIEQEIVAKVLSVIDAKIELNKRVNAELEAMAKTLYDYWFVQFDFPDANGKPYKISGGKMVYNAELKREIPEGWDVAVVENVLGKTPSSTKVLNQEIVVTGSIPVIDQSQDYICGFTDDITALIKPKQPHIVFGDHTRTVKLVNFEYARGADGTQILLSNDSRMPGYLLYQVVSDIDLSNYGYARHFKFLKDSKIILPNETIATRYQQVVTPWYEKIKGGIFENQHLMRLRDWLLPMLMNGQVTII